ncbi:hydantoinase/oxoprolinase family protein [Paraburkholderia gardini]|uniref:hydantoinase/oxoprolinase family protein n=1 Tax=Paraburkholderia gardini TaxID=2823469 RepID=UPI001E071379|nr:hydantoinase/oxoprolinase family protein [Paraburkholderia gardini]CAG4925945.1 Acetophenone carboxylase gamma subunit [Paraburkholderia gardini]
MHNERDIAGAVVASGQPRVRLSVDIGGTFTDVVLETGERRLTKKVLTTPEQPERAVLEGAQLVLDDAGLVFADIDVFVHGTTLATNAVLERRGARTALIGTMGFRDIVEIGTEGRYDQYDLQIEKQVPLVPRALRLTVEERMNAKGDVLLPLNERMLHRHIDFLHAQRVESVAICFLHAYANAAHEQRAREIVARALPELSISISSEVCPEIREYERTSTTLTNAYVKPLMSAYLGRMRTSLDAVGFRGPLYLVTSNGGLTSVETACQFPVRLVESGPAGGAIFAADVARIAGERKVLAFDMGGTTAKVCLIDEFNPDHDRVYEVDRAARFQKGSGLPLRIPVIDLVEIGAGGGSIARIDALKNIVVGPQSAGSVPGPACYGRGGTQPTVTDADVVLGLIDPAAFAGGSVHLDVEASRAALQSEIAGAAGMTPELAAFAVYEMVCESMASAARAHAIEKGKGFADRTLIAFGGAAPLHVARVAEKIGASRVLVPPGAGVGSAVGFLRAPVAYEIVRSYHVRLDSFDAGAVGTMLGAMETEARAVVREGAAGAPMQVRRVAFMRYVGQGHEIAVDTPSGDDPAACAQILGERFATAYTRLFNRTIPGAPVEILSWSVNVSAHSGAACASVRAPDCPAAAVAEGEREYFDGHSGARIPVPVYRRETLGRDARVSGPALIVERETTTFVTATFDAEIDRHGNIVLQRKQQQQSGDRT